MNKENLQTVLAIVSTILAIVSVAIMIAVFLLNFSTKEDVKELKTDTNRGFSEARADRKEGSQGHTTPYGVKPMQTAKKYDVKPTQTAKKYGRILGISTRTLSNTLRLIMSLKTPKRNNR
jgi:hypothetical protein